MRIFYSMSSTLWGLLDGKLSFKELAGSDAHFCFGCMKCHLFGPRGQVPHEMIYKNELKPRTVSKEWRNESQYPSIFIDDDNLDILYRFRRIVEAADNDGRAHWKVGHYHNVVRSVPPDAMILLSGDWRRAGDIVAEMPDFRKDLPVGFRAAM